MGLEGHEKQNEDIILRFVFPTFEAKPNNWAHKIRLCATGVRHESARSENPAFATHLVADLACCTSLHKPDMPFADWAIFDKKTSMPSRVIAQALLCNAGVAFSATRHKHKRSIGRL